MNTAHNSYRTVIGIDPGLTGGIGCSKPHQVVTAFAMPSTEGDLLELLRNLIDPGETIAFLEEVGGFAGKNQPGSHMFKFGRNFGFILGALQTLHVRTELVRPQKWQKALGLGNASSCATRTAWKNKLKAASQRLYPNLRPTLATADALLILDFGLKTLKQDSREERARRDRRAKNKVSFDCPDLVRA